MGKIKTRDLTRFSYHYPRNTAIVSVKYKKRENCMAVAWHSSLSHNPPMYGVSITPPRFTHHLISEAGEFVVNFVPFTSVKKVAAVGGRSGKDTDKFSEFGLMKDDPLVIESPILRDAYAAYECKLVSDDKYGDHTWFVGEVVAACYDEDAFDGSFKIKKVKPILYLGGDIYVETIDPKIYRVSRKKPKLRKL